MLHLLFKRNASDSSYYPTLSLLGVYSSQQMKLSPSSNHVDVENWETTFCYASSSPCDCFSHFEEHMVKPT